MYTYKKIILACELPVFLRESEIIMDKLTVASIGHFTNKVQHNHAYMYSCDLLKSKKKIEFSIIVLHIDTIIQHADILFLDVEKIHLACKGQNNVTIINAFIVISQFLALYILENLKT